MSQGRILLVEDNLDDAEIARLYLGSFEIVHAKCVKEALGLLEDGGDFKIVLLDLGLPDGKGLDTVEMLCDVAGAPVVVMSGMSGEETVVGAIERGAVDYLSKDGIKERWEPRVIHAIADPEPDPEEAVIRASLDNMESTLRLMEG